MRKEFAEARRALDQYANEFIIEQLGIVPGKTIITDGRGVRYIFSRTDGMMWMYGHRQLKNGDGAKFETNLYESVVAATVLLTTVDIAQVVGPIGIASAVVLWAVLALIGGWDE